MLLKLKEAFDEFDLKGAESCVEQLLAGELSERERELVEQCRQACEDIDYEVGSELLEKFL